MNTPNIPLKVLYHKYRIINIYVPVSATIYSILLLFFINICIETNTFLSYLYFLNIFFITIRVMHDRFFYTLPDVMRIPGSFQEPLHFERKSNFSAHFAANHWHGIDVNMSCVRLEIFLGLICVFIPHRH